MKPRIMKRYSISFRRQVISELENGRFSSIREARQYYGIKGHETVQLWLRKYGKSHLMAKVVRVEKPEERDRMRQLKQQIAQLEKALGQTQAENVLNRSFLKLACEELGQDVDSFKKKVDIAPCMKHGKNHR